MPGPIQTTINRFRNLVTRSNNNINTIRFRNARMTTASGASSTVTQFFFLLIQLEPIESLSLVDRNHLRSSPIQCLVQPLAMNQLN